MARHRARVAKAEIDVFVTVDVDEMRAARFCHERWVGACPLHHPVHRDALEEGLPGALEQRTGLRVVGDEP